ncbi:hypothetical protein B0F90DRAFT_1667034 [Multifurca ochricompacta]|uniref:Uncharacterized protein n=1 Tax=Multifurca ochricompacta TaxID=376703 RepID=A0AAD4QM76_9AGAM|nr:hypothetical protein B0F90DRAFT_1667034 [Multifurca ochricompacta]
MSTTTDTSRTDNTNVQHTSPIPILTSHRRRSSSSSSDGSPASPPALQTPTSFYPTVLPPSSPTGSPLFSYFMSTSPKTNASFPYRRPPGLGAPPVFEDDEGQDIEVRNNSLHQRRATTSWAGAGRMSSQRTAIAPPVIEEQQARGAGVLRRLLSVEASAGPPSPPLPSTPPPSAVTPPATPGFVVNRASPDSRGRVRRSVTLSVPAANARRRAPSPMGERILKGHFDGFN